MASWTITRTGQRRERARLHLCSHSPVLLAPLNVSLFQILASISAIVLLPGAHQIVSNNNGGGGGGTIVLAAASSKVKVETGPGWTEVNSGWPLTERNYFVATDKGHHFINVHDLPKNLNEDLDVTLEYYYSYARVKPTLEMVPCNKKVLLEEAGQEGANKWQRHSLKVNHKDCLKRNELEYNVLLHDTGDLFAWRLMSIKSVVAPIAPDAPPTSIEPPATIIEEPVTTPQVPATEAPKETTDKVTVDDHDEEISKFIDDEAKVRPAKPEDGDNSITDKPKEDPKDIDSEKTDDDKKKASSDPDKDDKDKDKAEDKVEDKVDKKVEDKVEDKVEEKVDKKVEDSAEDKVDKTVEDKVHDKVEDQVENKVENKVEDQVDHKIENKFDDKVDKNVEDKLEGKDKVKAKDDNDGKSNDEPLVRHKRFADDNTKQQQPSKAKPFVRLDETCRPSSCNRQRFVMARFSALVDGVPQLAKVVAPNEAAAQKYYLNLNNKPLKLKLESSETNLNEVDSCIKFQLYMEDNAELELLLEQRASLQNESGERLLEVIKPSAGSGRAKWQQLERCISDYMPRLSPDAGLFDNQSPSQSATASSSSLPSSLDNSVKFLFKSRSRVASKAGSAPLPGKVALVINALPNQAGYLRKLYPIQGFLPDIRLIKNERSLSKFWLLNSQDRAKKPTVTFRDDHQASGATTTTTTPTRSLIVSDIGATSANENTFDITSRWLKIRGADLLEQPVLFVYRIERADWIDKIEFQYQRAGDFIDDWISQVAYTRPAPEVPTAPPPAAAAGPSGQVSPSDGTPTTTIGPQPAAPNSLIDIPIKLKGIDSSEFRVRVRHHFGTGSGGGGGGGSGGASRAIPTWAWSRSLTIKSLAFADACSYKRQYCQNSALCNPTGPAQAECICLPGYRGKYCEHPSPCEIFYGKQSGYELCKSIGARCADGLPVLRCEWPNDRYYKCDKLFKVNADGKYEPIGTDASGADGNPASGGSGSGGGSGGGGSTNSDAQPVVELTPAEQIANLRGTNNEQAKLIIILTVFTVSILIFAIVLIISMVTRLRKSSRRLKESQVEVHELARRIRPGGGGGGGNGSIVSTSFGRAQTKTIGYNNSAFDVE